MADDDMYLPPLGDDANVQPLKQWLERELPIYLTQVGHGATLDEFRHHVGKLLPDQPPEVTWVFGLDGYLDCGDLDTIIDAVWERRR